MRTMISYSTHQSKIPRAHTPTQTATASNSDADLEHRQQPATPTQSPQVVTPRPLSPSEQTVASGASSHYSQKKRNQGFFPSKDDNHSSVVRQQQQQLQQQRRQDSYDHPESASVYSSSNSEPVDLTNLLKHIERREWMQVVKFFERCPHAPKQKAPSGNLPLHEALKHNPPLPVVNLLLEMHDGALRTTGAHGYLPLHVACNCRHIGVDVVTRLVVGNAAALRTREPTRDCLPLHLAVQTGVSEEVLMELLTNYPEASFVQDNLGKIPLDYAQESVHHHNRSIVALETAPILLAAAQAAQTRVSKEFEFKMNGLRDAHKEYVRQLEERFEEERTSFLEDQIQFSNDLAQEKERNISLAEMLLDVKASEKSLIAQRDQLQVQLDQEIKEFRTMIETQEAELRLVLEEADLQEAEVESSTDRALPGEEKKTDKSLRGTLKNLTKSFNDSKVETASLREELLRHQEMVRHLNQLLTTKDDEISQLKQKLAEMESLHKAASEREAKLSEKHSASSKELSTLREEMEELKQISHESQSQLEKYRHTVEVQGNRLGTVKNLVATLNFNMESWEREDKGRDQRTTGDLKARNEEDDRSTVCNSTLGDEVDLSNDSGNCMTGTTVVVTKVDENERHNALSRGEGDQSSGTAKIDDSNSVPAEVEKDEMGDDVSRTMTSEDSISGETASDVAESMDEKSNDEEVAIMSDCELAKGEMEV